MCSGVDCVAEHRGPWCRSPPDAIGPSCRRDPRDESGLNIGAGDPGTHLAPGAAAATVAQSELLLCESIFAVALCGRMAHRIRIQQMCESRSHGVVARRLPEWGKGADASHCHNGTHAEVPPGPERREKVGRIRMPVTSHDVARLAGVSQPTVSRALRQDSQVSAATRARVLAAAESLGYVPSELGRSLSTRSTRQIAMVADLDNPLYPQLVGPLHDAFAAQQFPDGAAGRAGRGDRRRRPPARRIGGRRGADHLAATLVAAAASGGEGLSVRPAESGVRLWSRRTA